MEFLTETDMISLHIEAYNMHPFECQRCQEKERVYVLKLDFSKGFLLAHEKDLEKIEE